MASTRLVFHGASGRGGFAAGPPRPSVSASTVGRGVGRELVHVRGRGLDSLRFAQGRIGHEPFDLLVIFLAGLAGVLQALPEFAVGLHQVLFFLLLQCWPGW